MCLDQHLPVVVVVVVVVVMKGGRAQKRLQKLFVFVQRVQAINHPYFIKYHIITKYGSTYCVYRDPVLFNSKNFSFSSLNILVWLTCSAQNKVNLR